MPFLILDLDLTVYALQNELKFLDTKTHHYQASVLKGKFDDRFKLPLQDLYLINPHKLTELLETSCMDGLIILTAGLWDEERSKNILLRNLNLSPSAQKKVNNCIFIAPHNTQHHFPDLSITEIQHVKKIRRFRKFLKENKELRNKHFVYLDDNLNHIASFDSEPRVTAIPATTRVDQITYSYKTNLRLDAFYQQAIDALHHAQIKEADAKRKKQRKQAKQTCSSSKFLLNAIDGYYGYVNNPRRYHFWNEAKCSYEVSKKSDLLNELSRYKGDKLKGAILGNLKDQIDGCLSLDVLDYRIKTIKQSEEYKLLSTSQGFVGYLLSRTKRTESIKAFDEMVSEKVAYLLKRPNLDLMLN